MLNLKLLDVRSEIYDQFDRSSVGPDYFFLPENEDSHAAYYTSMYLIQDTGESVMAHMNKGFSSNAMSAYLEFWGVMQAISIQQDAICELHKAVIGRVPSVQSSWSWSKLRETRHRLAGHPAKRTHGVPGTQRAFMGRSFGSYEDIRYELWDASTRQITHPTINLRQMIIDYDKEASTILSNVLSDMKSRWP